MRKSIINGLAGLTLLLSQGCASRNWDNSYEEFLKKYKENQVEIRKESHAWTEKNEYKFQRKIDFLTTKSGKELQEEITIYLGAVPHSYSDYLEDFWGFSERENNIQIMSRNQLYRVYLLLKELQNQEFVDNLGNILEEDRANEFTEYGGTINYDGKRLIINLYESENAKFKDIRFDNQYDLPYKALRKPHIMCLHFHNDIKENIIVGPSIGYDAILGHIGDIPHCLEKILRFGSAHDIVIEWIGDKEFNIDYYGGEKVEGYENQLLSVPGINFSVLDLGNYNYKFKP